jgi:hypothetical protein
VKRHKEFVELKPIGNTIPNNPSPSNDPYFEDPNNLAELRRRIFEIDQSVDNLSIINKEKQNELLGL